MAPTSKYIVPEKMLQDTASYYGRIHNLPPLSAKIYAYLKFDFSREGISFTELVAILNASKSSVSESLKILEKSDLIIRICKIDARTRLYRLNPDYLFIRFLNLIKNMESERDLLSEFRLQKKKSKVKNERLDQVMSLYTQALDDNIRLINKTIKKLKSIK
jgi:DNA-binding transcriptional regulator GbsR (MarR family)